ncbi:MAG: DUF3999 family protein [Flavobacteriales bacterium]|nr:DUF3999 family protein [Flavobacteriales bacterium]
MKVNLILFFTLLYLTAFGQLKNYECAQELTGVSEQWHTVILPDSVFKNVSNSLSDIRIIGIRATNDTVEVPYILQISEEKIERKEIGFKKLNRSNNAKGHFFTFEIPTETPINRIILSFDEDNFDRKIQLEGSNGQREWFGIVVNYRIVSIKNELTDYRFTTVKFPRSKYRYLRLLIKGKDDPKLLEAKIIDRKTILGEHRTYSTNSLKIEQNKRKDRTLVSAKMEFHARIDRMEIKVADTIDFYRPVTIQYATDSIKTADGWKWRYTTLTTGTLSSLEENTFSFPGRITDRIRILINDGDNEPLSVKSITVKGRVHTLMARFPQAKSYHLLYGNRLASAPNYDLDHFPDRIQKRRLLSNSETSKESRKNWWQNKSHFL